MNTNNKPCKLIVDNQHYEWPTTKIKAEEIRQLASLPGADTVNLFHKVPGHNDVQVMPGDTVDLGLQPGTDHFSTMAIGSSAGA